jgi:hypothetical protein
MQREKGIPVHTWLQGGISVQSKKWTLRVLLVALSLFLLGACEGNDPSVNAGRLRVKLTDGSDFAIKELYLHVRGVSVFVTDTVTSDGEWADLECGGGEYNLLKLFNGKNVTLVDQYFPAGKEIRKVRLLLGNNNRILTYTAKSYPLQLPSEIIEGIEVDLMEPILLEPYIISSLIIDVNAAHSVRERDGNYFIHPYMRAFPEMFGSTLQGYVNPAEFTTAIAIIKDPDTLFTLPEQDGMFSFAGLTKGEWEVYLFSHPASLYADTAFIWNIDTTGVVNITPKPIRLPQRSLVPDEGE